MTSETKTCRQCEIRFEVTPDDLAFYEKMQVPVPGLCPSCRFRRRAAFRNEFTLYNRPCDLCGNSIVSMYSTKTSFKVYCPDCWHSDRWDPFSYGRDYDRNRPFFDQFKELTLAVPKIALYRSDVLRSVNSPYENYAGGNKDCYLVSNAGPANESCAYSRGLIKSRDVFDSYYVDESDRIYEGVGIHNSAGIIWAQNAFECLDSAYILNSTGLQNCFGCVNLRHKKHHFLNEPFSRDEYERRTNVILGSYRATENFKGQFEALSLRLPRRENSNFKSVNVSGDYIFESKNCHCDFELSYCENLSYSFSTKLAKDAYDILGHGRNAELLLEAVATGFSSRVIASWWVENGQNIEYCLSTRNSKDCFGCDGIKGGQYALLNKRYPAEEYKSLKSRIIGELKNVGEYGLFLPSSLALFGYNETIGQDNMPLKRDEALKFGFRWEEDIQVTRGKETLRVDQIPDHIRDVPDSITNEVLTCITCSRNYKIIKSELEFYRRLLIPIPRKCFYCRHRDRIERRGPLVLYDRTCVKCDKPIRTTYAPVRPEIVYCEECYQREVI